MSADTVLNIGSKEELEKKKEHNFFWNSNYEDDKRSFWEKWNDHVADRQKTGKHVGSAKKFARGLFAIQAPTQLFMFHVYIIPFLFEDYDTWTRYYLKVMVTFFCFEETTNFLCVILYNTSIPDTRDRPTVSALQNNWESPPDRFVGLNSLPNHSRQNGSAVHNAMNTCDNGSLSWAYCDICQKDKPPRAHHCKICKKCILKRDHHCYVVGNCIGYLNQRYFVVLTFYTVICGFVGFYFTYRYLATFFYPECYSWTDFLPPFALFRWLFGTTAISLHVMIMIFQMYLELLFGFVGFVYFTSQMTIISQGKTLYELANGVPIKSMNTINSNFKSVFGDFWALNFLFPMQIIFRQREDGTKWDGIKLDHNANQEKCK